MQIVTSQVKASSNKAAGNESLLPVHQPLQRTMTIRCIPVSSNVVYLYAGRALQPINTTGWYEVIKEIKWIESKPHSLLLQIEQKAMPVLLKVAESVAAAIPEAKEPKEAPITLEPSKPYSAFVDSVW
jgi:hypothetical protein